MNTRSLLCLSRTAASPLGSSFAATACLSSRRPQYFNRPQINAPLSTDTSSSNTNATPSSPPPPPPEESQVNQLTRKPQTPRHSIIKGITHHKTGTVISAGKRDKVVQVVHITTHWDRNLHKYYPLKTRVSVSDPNNSLREGDVIEFSNGFNFGNPKNVVERIIAPFETPISARPPVLTEPERFVDDSVKRMKGSGKKLGPVKRQILEKLLHGGMLSKDRVEHIKLLLAEDSEKTENVRNTAVRA
ncbi:uncharacterized protein CIMG_01732 [Coccidioides immitis RS]|uniref:Nucleic acid-binding protein n=1 Tax=Coccidioides immitis (strain RS) TaxID=246410 RepID=A0A0E1S579_COCIM|nr:uncharacterized protein CIMG_01732 [Coccidioides immitis RS]EAS36378.2 hypothetical protein CIMG_01732 [Coccidioides immitis RS]